MDEPPAYLQYPRITLAPDDPPKPDLTLAWPLRSYDMLNRWRLVHCAYGYNEKLEMLVAYAIDAEGDGWEIRTWPGTPFIMLPGRVDELWELFTGFAAAAAIEWRVTISRLGIMGTDEYDCALPRQPFDV
jgi:hypothetical protein